MMRPLWPLLTLAAAAADKEKQLVAPAAAAPDQEKPLYLFGHIPKCGGVSFVADLVGRLHLTSCFGRKAVVAKGENWTHAMERGRCNFVNTEQWLGEHGGMVRHFPRPPRIAILVRNPEAHVRSLFASCGTVLFPPPRLGRESIGRVRQRLDPSAVYAVVRAACCARRDGLPDDALTLSRLLHGLSALCRPQSEEEAPRYVLAAFDADAEGNVWIFEVFLSFCFITDLCISFFTAIWEDGAWVTDRGRIAQVYLSGWFWIDAPSSLPLELLDLLPGDTDQFSFLRFLRMFRLLRLLKLLKLDQMIEQIEEQLEAALALLDAALHQQLLRLWEPLHLRDVGSRTSINRRRIRMGEPFQCQVGINGGETTHYYK